MSSWTEMHVEYSFFVFARDGKHANKKAWFSELCGGGESNNLEDKPESLSLQELTAINCELLSLIFP